MLNRLRLLDAAVALAELREPPGNRLEKLTGNSPGQHGVRVTQQWRLCFRWKDSAAHDVEIVHGKRATTADIALRLGRYLSTSAQFWLNLQTRFDRWVERDRLGPRFGAEVSIYADTS